MQTIAEILASELGQKLEYVEKVLSLIDEKGAYVGGSILPGIGMGFDALRDAELLPDGEKNAFSLFFGQDRAWRPADHLLCDGEVIALGDAQIKVVHTPGHTRGSVCYLCGDDLITGDTLFADGYGRCDLYGGDWGALCTSLRKLTELSPTLRIYPGHGQGSTLGDALGEIGLV